MSAKDAYEKLKKDITVSDIQQLKKLAGTGDRQAIAELGILERRKDPALYGIDMASKLMETNEPRVHEIAQRFSESMGDYTNALYEGIDQMDDAHKRYREAVGGAVKSVREKRMMLASEHATVVKDLKDLVTILSGDDYTLALERLERLVTLAERLALCAKDGWVEKALLLLLEQKS